MELWWSNGLLMSLIDWIFVKSNLISAMFSIAYLQKRESAVCVFDTTLVLYYLDYCRAYRLCPPFLDLIIS
jgi:hypothetical protein